MFRPCPECLDILGSVAFCLSGRGGQRFPLDEERLVATRMQPFCSSLTTSIHTTTRLASFESHELQEHGPARREGLALPFACMRTALLSAKARRPEPGRHANVPQGRRGILRPVSCLPRPPRTVMQLCSEGVILLLVGYPMQPSRAEKHVVNCSYTRLHLVCLLRVWKRMPIRNWCYCVPVKWSSVLSREGNYLYRNSSSIHPSP